MSFYGGDITSGDNPEQTYVEPFVGGANVIWRMSGNRIGTDLCGLMIDFWRATQEGFVPAERFTKKSYDWYKSRYADREDFASLSLEQRARIAWYGFACSFNGSWFQGYNAQGGTLGNLMKQIPALASVEFGKGPYTMHTGKLEDCLIYCDPPYSGTMGYDAVGSFDHSVFWSWASKMARDNTVMVSEATLPPRKYIADTIPYETQTGPRGVRQEYLIRVAAR